MTPDQRRVLTALTDEEFDRLTPEQVTLFLARMGFSPLDTQASLERALQLIDDYKGCLGPRRKTK